MNLSVLADALESGRTTAEALVEECLARISDPGGQGGTSFTHVDRHGARVAAAAMDRLRVAGAHPSPFAGIPISVKDLFDVRGQVTRAGSVVLQREPAAADAAAVARLRAAGLVIVGRTNMTEFAYSGLGLNSHYGTPLGPWMREERRIAGGSTSGGAASVADMMAHAALGTDTGGSCRIPAAWCGLVGFKPTANRIPRSGSVPLSATLDTVGTIARSVECCAILDSILTQRPATALAPRSLSNLRIGAVENIVLEGCDADVADAYEQALRRLERAGARIVRTKISSFDKVAGLNSKGGFPAAEAYAWHRDLLATSGPSYDPRVASRILRGKEQDAADYIQLTAGRMEIVAAATEAMSAFDVIAMPTTPILPPRLADLEDDPEYTRINLLALRNPTMINMIDGCAISVPATAKGESPVGLMLAGPAGTDEALLATASSVAAVLNPG